MYTRKIKRELDGVIVKKEQDEDVKITTVTIEEVMRLGKELGKSRKLYYNRFSRNDNYETRNYG